MVSDIACQALKAGKVLELRYNGFSRCVEVHAVGTSKAGNLVMSCWQTRGGSTTNEPVGWKLMKLEDVQSAAISDESSQAPRTGYKRGDSRMPTIICEL
jgi:hypothetical protein